MKKIFVLTGEPSGDKLASTIISKLKSQNAEETFEILPEENLIDEVQENEIPTS